MTDSILRSSYNVTSSTFVPFPAETPEPLFLDTWSGATAAYSFRKLRNGYAGSAVRIRRSSDNAELNVGFVGEDFDTATAASHIGGGSGFITTWYDQSGGGANLTQATSGLQPQYSATGYNSLPTMLFDHTTNNHLQTATDAVTVTAQSFALSVVYQQSTGSLNNDGIVEFIGTGEANSFNNDHSFLFTAQDSGGTGNAVLMYVTLVDAPSGAPINKDNPIRVLANFVRGTNNKKIYENASLIATNNGAAAGNIGNPSGTLNIGASQCITGKMSEVVLWPTSQLANVAAIDADLDLYW